MCFPILAFSQSELDAKAAEAWLDYQDEHPIPYKSWSCTGWRLFVPREGPAPIALQIMAAPPGGDEVMVLSVPLTP